MKKFLEAAHIDSAELGFSPGVVVDDLVFADASARNFETGRLDPAASSVAEETRLCLERLGRTLREAGLSLANVVKVNAYLSDESYRAEFWKTFDEVLAPGPYPVRITQVTDLGESRVLIDAIASN